MAADLIRRVAAEGAAPLATNAYAVEDLVEARFGGGERWVKGKITKVHGDGTYDVLYDDGNREGRSFWAEVIGTQEEANGETHYITRNADGVESSHRRRDLRHRKLHTEAFMGISGDRKHDS